MSLIKKINRELKLAMLSKDKLKLDSLRAIKSSLILHQTSNSSQNEITEKEEIKILQKLVKQRQESANIFMNQNRLDLAKPEKDQADYISKFLPKQLTNLEISNIISNVISEIKADGLKDIGKVIKLVVMKTEGRADGKSISNIVRHKLSK
ncbi:MAG: glutamyl-tRNA amidotransferase [Flavobacteriaceae bacterium]|nr:glutamyl-tRNA amidotransferase [Flavobacteriaceae bacterium]|tara:strand:- start:20 stop:472 length:453 start_codon:yes stop_codon:yes gene_type:complete